MPQDSPYQCISMGYMRKYDGEKDALTEAEASIMKIASGDIFLTEAEIFSLRRLKPL